MDLSSRQKQIMDRLQETNGVLSSAEITAVFNVTVQTIRKDLNELKKDVKEILRLMNALYDFEVS